MNENRFFNFVPESLDKNLAALDGLGGAQAFQPLSVRLDLGGQHAVPPVETGDLSGRHQRSVLRSLVPGPEGRHQLRYEFEVTGKPEILKGKGAPGRGQLYIDGKLVGQVEMPVTTPLALGLASGVAVGLDLGAPVTDEYRPPFAFAGKIHTVTIDVSGELIMDDEAALRAVMARQWHLPHGHASRDVCPSFLSHRLAVRVQSRYHCAVSAPVQVCAPSPSHLVGDSSMLGNDSASGIVTPA